MSCFAPSSRPRPHQPELIIIKRVCGFFLQQQQQSHLAHGKSALSMLCANQKISLSTLQQHPGVVFSFISMKCVITAAWKWDKPQFHHPLHFSFSLCSISSFSRLTSLHVPRHIKALQAYLKGFTTLPSLLHSPHHTSIPSSFHLQPSAFSSVKLSLLERFSPVCQPGPLFKTSSYIFPIKYFKTRTS